MSDQGQKQSTVGNRKRCEVVEVLTGSRKTKLVVKHWDLLGFEGKLAQLASPSTWSQLLDISSQVANVTVENPLTQGLVDDARSRLDAVHTRGDHGRMSLIALVIAEDGECDTELLKALLAAGLDPDQPDAREWRPSHWCSLVARMDYAAVLFPCRPDAFAKNDSKHTPTQAAGMNYTNDVYHPLRQVARADVAAYLKNGSFDLAGLAARKMWFAVKNLLRRQVALKRDFESKAGGKTAEEWARFHGNTDIVKEMRYYGNAPASQLQDAPKQLRQIAVQLCMTEEKVLEMEKQVEELRREIGTKDAKIEELSEALLLLQTKMDGSESIDPPEVPGADPNPEALGETPPDTAFAPDSPPNND